LLVITDASLQRYLEKGKVCNAALTPVRYTCAHTSHECKWY